MKYYSKTTKGFYDLEIHGNTMPADAVEVSDEAYHLLFTKQSEGEQIVSDDNGYPITIITPVSPITWEQIKVQRDALLQQSDWTVLTDASPKPSVEAWLEYRQALRDIPQDFDSPEDIVWPTKP